MSEQRISKIAEELLKSGKYSYEISVSYVDLDILHEIFEKAGLKNKISHPLNKHRSVLNALDRESKKEDAIFEKAYFRSYKGLARMFVLKDKKINTSENK